MCGGGSDNSDRSDPSISSGESDVSQSSQGVGSGKGGPGVGGAGGIGGTGAGAGPTVSTGESDIGQSSRGVGAGAPAAETDPMGSSLDYTPSPGWTPPDLQGLTRGPMEAKFSSWGWAGRKFGAMLDNPFSTIVDVLASLAPLPAGPIGMALGIGKTAMNVGALFGLNPTIGQTVTAMARGEIGNAPTTNPDGSVSTPAARDFDNAPVGPNGGSVQGGGSGSGWNEVSSLLAEPQAPSTSASASTSPSTISSTDQRSSYGFSPGQGVNYADLTDGFGGTNVGARGGWRASGGAGGWA